MDFIIIYSNYSQACAELFTLYPNLYTKGICADHKTMRAMLSEKLNVLVVPTLLVVTPNDIIQRVIGLDDIKNWLWLTSTQIDSVRMEAPDESQEPQQPMVTTRSEPMVSSAAVTPMDASEQMVTNLGNLQDDLMPPSQDMSHALKSNISIKSTAEELQRERDHYMETLKQQQR